MNIFSKLKDAYIHASLHNGRRRAHQELVRMSERQLADFGFSKELLKQGVKAWPWQLETESNSRSHLSAVSTAANPRLSKRVIQQAVKELDSLSDRELTELGITRDGIEEVVKYGRPEIEGVLESHKHAA